MNERILKYGVGYGGFCRLRVDVGHPGIEVSVSPLHCGRDVEHGEIEAARVRQQELADQLAEDIADNAAALAAVRRELAREKATTEHLRDSFDRLRRRWQAAVDSIEALTSNKRRRHYGRTRVRITERGVWMLDWEKDSRGFGLWYETIADLWREWPELRPVACGQDDDSPWMEVVHQPITQKNDSQ
jgi:hypothetical protein